MKRLTIMTITAITIVLLYLLINVLASIAWAEIGIAGILATCLLLLGLAALFGGQTAITVLAFQRGFAWGVVSLTWIGLFIYASNYWEDAKKPFFSV